MSGASAAARLHRAPVGPASWRAVAQLSLAIAALGITPILFRLSELGPAASSFYRTALALPCFAAWVLAGRRRAARRGGHPDLLSWRRDGLALLAGGVFFAANILTYASALRFTAVANASLLSNLSPIFVALGGGLLFGDRPSRGFLAAMLLAILGVIVLTGDRLTVDGGQAEGNALALLSAVLFGTYLLAIGRLSLRLPAAPIMLWVSVVSTLVLLAASLASGESLLPATARGWSVLLLLAIVSYALGQGLLAVALARLGAAFSAVSLLFLPVIAALLGWLVLGEALTPHQALGGAIVLASILGARRARR